MTEQIFPFLEPQAVPVVSSPLPVAREVKWDYDRDCPIYIGGQPVMVERAEAVAVWAWNALHTERWRWVLFTRDYGNEIDSLIGQTWSDDYKRAEVRRYITECLLVSPYIKRLEHMDISFHDGKLTAVFDLISIYGMVKMEVGNLV